MKSVILRIIILILLITLIYIPNTAYAMGDVISQGDSFLSARNANSPINEVALKSTSDYVYNILFTIAVVLAIAIGMIIGIQFIMGSVEEQAKIKETLIPYIVGVFVVFAAFGIWKIVVGIGNSATPTPLPAVVTQTTYTITKSGRTTHIKCDSCGHVNYHSTAPEKCPGCEYKFTTGHTTRTQVNMYTFRCDYCRQPHNPQSWRSDYCPSCNWSFK